MWKKAMHSELGALEKNDTWSFTLLPAGKSLVVCRWVFKLNFYLIHKCRDIRLVSLPKGSLKFRVLIIQKPLLEPT